MTHQGWGLASFSLMMTDVHIAAATNGINHCNKHNEAFFIA